MHRSLRVVVVLPLLWLTAGALPPRAPESIAPNDNRHAAGTLKDGVLTVRLETRTGVWHPEGDKGRAVALEAFAEEGMEPTTPGPLIRVRAGTDVRVLLRNSHDKPLVVFGLGRIRGSSDSTIIAPHATSDLRFTAATPGTYYYTARRELDPASGGPTAEDLQLGGAIVVDPPTGSAADRVFVIGWWLTVDPRSPTGLGRGTMTINGLSWPHTEKLDYAQGDSVRWRVVNLTGVDHPMHLHGFYFRVNAKGDGATDSLYTAERQKMAVTEIVTPGTTMAIAWKAARPGNWIFHCHYATHLSSTVALDTDNGTLDGAMLDHHMSDRPHQMYGLVMGIRVAPRGTQASAPAGARPIRLLVRDKPKVFGDQSGFSFVLGGTPDEANPDAMPVPGPTLVLERDKPVAVTIINRSTDRAAVHWHGIELESYPDGVPGWSGSGAKVLPSIGPGDSITVRFTPPRAGSFMYHSHFNEEHQIGTGLYGPIVVVEPGTRLDAETDKLLFFGTAGYGRNPVFGPFPAFVMNGKTQPDAMNLKVGTRYRFRLFNLAGDQPLVVSLNEGAAPVTWLPVAKDGYPLQPSQARPHAATLQFEPGEIYDYEYTPTVAGDLTLTFGPVPPPPGSPPPPPIFSPPPPTVKVLVHVR
jgi:FtsP/CotA-like multicopper oxidase with cupredoxin domain